MEGSPVDLNDLFEQRPFYTTRHGAAYLGDALNYLRQMDRDSVDLIITSPPFALKRKKEYGNVDAKDYVPWFVDFAVEFKRILKDEGSLVIDIGGTWVKGQPTRSLYHFELVIALVRTLGFQLAQEFYWYNPSKLPSPAEWVTVRRIRVKDAVNPIWWLSKTPYPKANNKKVLRPYSDSMLKLLENGYKAKLRPSGHDISENFAKDNKGAIPPNLLDLANTDSNSSYLRACREHNIKPHPARFPHGLPDFFIKFLTDPGDLVVDPFAGSNITGEVAEGLQRRWLAFDLVEEYLEGSKFRFPEVYHQGYMFGQPHGESTREVAPAAEPNEEDEEELLEQPRLLESLVEYQSEEE
jgi:DNA modification methylase